MKNKCIHYSSDHDIYDIWHADKSTRLYRNEMLRYRHLFNLMPDKLNTIIDIGCGTGYMAFLLAKKKSTVTAVDLSQNRLTLFKDIAQRYHIRQIHADLFDLNINNFDGLISQEVLEHIEDYETALIEMYHFLKTSGYALFCVPYQENLDEKKIVCLTCGESYHKNGHLHSFTKDKFVNSITRAGFKILQVKLIVNKRVVKWLTKANLPINRLVLIFDGIMNFVAPHKAAYLAVLSQKVNSINKHAS